jgi:hypothetical protein
MKEEAIKWLKKAIDRHERHMMGEEPTDGKEGEISQRLMMEEMKYSLKLLMGGSGDQVKWYFDNLDKVSKYVM